jgi:hypothetical protein
VRRYEKFRLRIDQQDPWIWTFNDELQRRARRARVKSDKHQLPTPRNKQTPVDIMRDVCEAHYQRHSQRASSLRDLTGFKLSEILNSFLVTMMGRGAVHVGPRQSDPAPLVAERPPKNMLEFALNMLEAVTRDLTRANQGLGDRDRIVPIDTDYVGTTTFDLVQDDLDFMVNSGRNHTKAFLSHHR